MIRTAITNHLRNPTAQTRAQSYFKQKSLILAALVVVAILGMNCRTLIESRDVRPLVLRDVPAQRLAFRFEPDAGIPAELVNDAADTPVESIQLDFSSRRQEEALIKTLRSPDGQRALALYGTADTPGHVFRIDLYSADGQFIRNITPPDLSCVFPETVAWSPQGNHITFVARKTPAAASPSPTPENVTPPETLEASPLPSVAPAFPSVPLFATEQIYICDRDGYALKPLTSREGLIYFYFAWAPDNHALVAIACRESEWDAREREFKMPAGRPRLISLDGTERLLDDRLTEALPVWSADASKVATAFETDVMIYDAATNRPTQGRIRLGDPLLAASRIFDANQSGAQPSNENDNESNQTSTDVIPASYNPVVRLKWASPEKLYLQTAYVRLFPNDFTSTFQRWHLITLSPQAMVLR